MDKEEIKIPIDLIKIGPRARKDFGNIEELQSSIERVGLINPICINREDNLLIAGERRWRAAVQLGWKEIGAVIRDADDRTLLTLALVENLQRDALSAIDEAIGYKRLVDDYELSHGEIAELLGKNRSTVANSLRLLNLPASVQEMVQRGDIQMGHARALLQITDPNEIERIARLVVKLGLSVRETESRSRGTRTARRQNRKTRSPELGQPSPETKRVEDALRAYLKTDVSVTQAESGKGRLSIDFYSNDDLARLLELLLGRPFDG